MQQPFTPVLLVRPEVRSVLSSWQAREDRPTEIAATPSFASFQ